MKNFTKLIKTASKNKLIQLVIDSKETEIEGVPEEERTLTDEEIEMIYEKAKLENWIGELQRAKKKSIDYENLYLMIDNCINEALYNAQVLTNSLLKTKAILTLLDEKYLEYNKEGDLIIKNKGTKKDIEKIVRRYVNIFLDNSIVTGFSELEAKFTEGVDGRGNIFNNFKNSYKNIKLLTYTLFYPVMEGYRIYRKELRKEVGIRLSFTPYLLVTDLEELLEEIDYSIENLRKSIPEVINELEKYKDTRNLLYLPTEKEIGEMIDYLDEKIIYLPSIEENKKKVAEVDIYNLSILDEKYLLNDVNDKELEVIKGKVKILREYIKNGR